MIYFFNCVCEGVGVIFENVIVCMLFILFVCGLKNKLIVGWGFLGLGDLLERVM